MHCGLWFALVGVSLAGVAHAEIDDPVPGGISWYCYTVTNDFNPRDASGSCYRTEDRCTRAVANRESDKYGSSTITECRKQSNASVVTYYDVMNDQMRSWALPSTALCQSVRAFLQADPDSRRVSTCKLVGTKELPPGRFIRGRVSVGSAWNCTNRSKRYNACSRLPSECAESNGTGCKAQPTAFSLTWYLRRRGVRCGVRGVYQHASRGCRGASFSE